MSNNITAEEARSNMGKGISEAIDSDMRYIYRVIKESSGTNKDSLQTYVIDENIMNAVSQKLIKDGFHIRIVGGRLDISWAEDNPFVRKGPWWKFWR